MVCLLNSSRVSSCQLSCQRPSISLLLRSQLGPDLTNLVSKSFLLLYVKKSICRFSIGPRGLFNDQVVSQPCLSTNQVVGQLCLFDDQVISPPCLFNDQVISQPCLSMSLVMVGWLKVTLCYVLRYGVTCNLMTSHIS